MTRAEAKAQGLRYYDPQQPCSKGHTAVWVTSRGMCQMCIKEINDRPENKARRDAWRKTPGAATIIAQTKKRYRQTETGKAVERAYKDAYRPRENELARLRNRLPHNMTQAAIEAQRRRDALRRMHPTHRRKIAVIYQAAVALNLTVDHIIPLYGENVWGLHAPQNLQLLTREENSSKHNKVLS